MPDEGGDEAGRLAILDEQGRVVSIRPDGTDLTELGPAREGAFQPIWSPDGAQVAYATRAGTPALVVADADGGSSRRVELDGASFYFSWSPSGDQLSSLRNDPDGIGLDVIDDPSSETPVTTVDRGAPYWTVWDPDGGRLFVHAGVDRLDIVDDAGGVTPLGVVPGDFRVPDWTEDGLLTLAVEGGRQALVRVTPDGAVDPIAAIDGLVTFAANPAGTKVAIQSLRSEGPGGAIEAALPAQEPLPVNQLLVLDLGTGEITIASLQGVLAFWWSPEGDRLLTLHPGPGDGTLRWRVWDGTSLIDGPVFRPEASFVDEFLVFFDQYARSMTLWAPDGSRYSFPGRIGDEDGVWVADALTGEVEKVADGTWVAWSPS